MSIRRRFLNLTMIGVVAFAAVSCGKSGVQAAGENTDLTDAKIISLEDQKFLSGVEESEIRQLSLAQEALQRSQNAQVLDFAKRVVDHRTQALSGLKQLMADKKVEEALQAEVIRLEVANRLNSIPPDAVDHQVVSLMAAEQQQAVANLDSAAETSPDPDIRKYAAGAQPLLQTDYDTATDLEKKLAQ
jgi:putative membrane protein